MKHYNVLTTCEEFGIEDILDIRINYLKSIGIKAFHPNDGWVDDESNSMMLHNPYFYYNLEIGDKVALGDYCGPYRIVEIIEFYKFGDCYWFKFKEIKRIKNRRSYHDKLVIRLKLIKRKLTIVRKKPVKIFPPFGYEIDKEKSTSGNIVFKRTLKRVRIGHSGLMGYIPIDDPWEFPSFMDSDSIDGVFYDS